MSAKPSKQLGSLLGRVPSATAAGQGAAPSQPVPYAPAVELTKVAASVAPIANDYEEVPLQVLVPKRVRMQLDHKRAEARKSARQFVLEALRGAGLDVTDEEIAGKRGRKKS